MKAIKTRYKGIEFRSKLEARWAVFFDHYGMRWEYEKQSFRLKNNTAYCPDFYLPELSCYIEVKPLIKEERDKYISHAFSKDNFLCLTSLEYSKLINFELPICLVAGLPLETNFISFHFPDDWMFRLVYPCWDNDHWRWWACTDIEDYPTHRDIRDSANYARYYDFFNFKK
jgi:hypothetical protein